MNWLVSFWLDGNVVIVGKYNNYDLESGYMEYSLTARIRNIFPDLKIQRDEAGMAHYVGDICIDITPYYIV